MPIAASTGDFLIGVVPVVTQERGHQRIGIKLRQNAVRRSLASLSHHRVGSENASVVA